MPEERDCRLCGQRIIWAASGQTGNLLCLDSTPVENGQYYLVNGEAWFVTESLRLAMASELRHVDHLLTCKGKQ